MRACVPISSKKPGVTNAAICRSGPSSSRNEHAVAAHEREAFDRAAHRRRLRLPIEERRVRRDTERRVVAPLVDGLQAVGGRVGQTPNEDGVDDAEQGGRAADGERQREHGDRREHRSSAERANCLSEIGRHGYRDKKVSLSR